MDKRRTEKLPVIIITGYPGTGKTTLGKKISEKFGMPFISKDEIKEILFDSLGWSDVEWSIKLGAASYDLMFYFAKKIIGLGKPFILETFFSEISEKEIIILEKKFNIYPIQVVCTAPAETIISRVQNRVDLGQRHPGHVDQTREEELKIKVSKEYQPLNIGGLLIEIDTTNFDKIDYDQLYHNISDTIDKIIISKNNLLEKTIDFVDKSFGQKKQHYVRTLHWLLQLKPDADLAFQIAAYAHDVERAFKTAKGRKRLIYKTKAELIKHQKDSGMIMYDYLIKSDAGEAMANRVKELISKHEEGGTDDQNILRDCDSISYLEMNAPRNLEWLGEVPESEMREKFDWMYNRIGSKKAKEIAKPFYEKAVSMLEEKVSK